MHYWALEKFVGTLELAWGGKVPGSKTLEHNFESTGDPKGCQWGQNF